LADPREAILTRLVVVCAAVSGIQAAVRNRLDAASLRRPAVVVHDGAEQLLDAPQGERRSRLQRMELSPGITVVIRGDDGAEAGALMTLYRSRVVHAVLNDAELIGLVGTNGGIRYESAAVALPDAEAREYRITIEIVFTYPFYLSDLGA